MITPSFALTATERVLPRLALDFTTASLDPRVTFTRTGNTATVVNSSGFVEPINADLPRFDFDPITLVCKGLLIEEARSNLFKYSEDFTNAIWPKFGSSISSNAATSPGNSLTADKIVEDTTTGAHGIYYNNVSVTAGATYSQSIYAKVAGRTIFSFAYGNSTNAVRAFFNLTDKTATISNVGTGNTTSATITDVGNDWLRCTISGSVPTITSAFPEIVLVSTGTTTSYTGDGTSGILIWGAQLEAGAFATSYIPTTTTALTRNADVASMTGTNFSDWYNATEGSFVVNAAYEAVPVSDKAILFISDGTANNQIQIYASASGVTRFYMVAGGATQVNSATSSGVIQANTYIKQCCTYKQNNSVFAYNATINAVDTLCVVPVVDRLYVSFAANAWIKSLNYYPQRLTNNETQSFTKG